ncbi:glycerol-3-phosphate dehydrogenase subunit C [Tistlia consotensis]|uniref:Glycerol-3-phosphate dehydrogenase subunit C n=1 Tax=Tistlia consotensis USBA 355 TaxID=560819 RepID=A0A1Y6CRV0_9PROT|nr:heterodisulfide reductase-related iron-sulfur binding cluster [Tistlia consotensis]SMF74687.1 glycerol-3-phosphate dehydrogenase subunit C [Tistlia consotensis USBA 355]SNS11093.1 glycerol-3-phosphate dehydrogenase subunit C [Tistlia consotensis]
MREGSLDAPVRHPINWNDPDFYDMDKILAEMDRVFDICHGCRRCFNLCDSFPVLFDLIDESESGELDGVDKADYKKVADACTLCDMCFMVSCPYVPPHEFDLDFPHLMLRYRAAERKAGHNDVATDQLTRTDRNGRLASMAPGLANWASDLDNGLTRGLLESVARVDRQAALPKYYGKTFERRAKANPAARDAKAPAAGRKVVLYATCFANYNNPNIGEATLAVLARNGVEVEVAYPQCCGMPQFEQGKLDEVAEAARNIAKALLPYVDRGYDVVALVPSCALMMKFEWPLLLPDDAEVKRLAQATFDVTEYVVDIAQKEGLAEGLRPLEGGVAVHIACHARAQNMGNKAREMLKLIPDTPVKQLPRCSGHGGSWGVLKGNFETALKIGKPVARDVYKAEHKYVSSECPLAGMHILQGMERIAADQPEGERKPVPSQSYHPIELLAMAYGLGPAGGASR